MKRGSTLESPDCNLINVENKKRRIVLQSHRGTPLWHRDEEGKPDCLADFFFPTTSCAGQRPVVRPWRWAWAGEEWGQGPTWPWLLHQELGAAGGHSASLRRHLVWAVVPPRLPLASPPLALRRPPLAAGPPVRFQSVRPCKPTAACVPLSRRCMPQYAGHRTSPAGVAASGAQLPSPMALSCTHRSASSRVGRAPPVVASVHHSSTALVRWALGAAYRGHCRYT